MTEATQNNSEDPAEFRALFALPLSLLPKTTRKLKCLNRNTNQTKSRDLD